MKHLKTFENINKKDIDVGDYLVWHDYEIDNGNIIKYDDEYEILKVIHIQDVYGGTRYLVNTIYRLNSSDNKLKFINSNVDQYINENELDYCITFVSKNIEECKTKIIMLNNINKYNL